MKCTNCGMDLADDGTFCGHCGTKVAETKMKKDVSKGVAVAAAVIGITAVAMLGLYGLSKAIFNGNVSVNSAVVYYKEDAMLLADLKKEEAPVELTDSWTKAEDPFLMAGITYRQFISKDGSQVYYIEGYRDYSYNLYRASTVNPDESVKVDSRVDSHFVLDNNNVIYRKKGTYYYHDGKKKSKFGKDVYQMDLNEDQTVVLWGEYGRDSGDFRNVTYYYQPLDQKTDKVKIEGSVEEIFYDKDMTNFYVVKNGAISKIDADGNKERITRKIETVISCDPDAGTFYFTRAGKQKLALEEYVVADEGQTLDPDDLKGVTVTIPTRELYYYDGSNEVLLAERLPDDNSEVSVLASYCLYREYPQWDEIEIPYSRIAGQIWDLDGAVKEYLNAETGSLKLTVGPDGVELPESAGYRLDSICDEDLSMLYFAAGADAVDEDDAVLYQVSLQGKSRTIITELDQEVKYLAGATDQGIYYYKDYEKGSGDLYYNGEYIMPDVKSSFYLQDAALLVCTTDYNHEDECATVMIYDGQDITFVADYVMYVEGNQDGTLLMLADYDLTRYEGELLYYDGRETRMIDDDVTGFGIRLGSQRNWSNDYMYRR